MDKDNASKVNTDPFNGTQAPPFPLQWPFVPYYPFPGQVNNQRGPQLPPHPQQMLPNLPPLPPGQQACIPPSIPRPQNIAPFPHQQQQFFPNPTDFYNEQVQRNLMNKPSEAAIALNKKRLKEFRKAQKKKMKRERRREQKAVQQQNGFIVNGSGSGMSTPSDGLLVNRMKTKNNGSKCRGVSWDQALTGYVGRVWLRGNSEYLGVFPEELRAAVAVDERLLQLGVDDGTMLNFKTQLEREIALVLLLNSHRMMHSTHPSQKPILNPKLNLPIPIGVTQWPHQPDIKAELDLVSNISRDQNGFPNDICSVLTNILKKSTSSFLSPFGKLSHQEGTPAVSSATGTAHGPKKMTSSKHHKVAASERKATNGVKRHRTLVQEEKNGDMTSNIKRHRIACRKNKNKEKKQDGAETESSNGYVGDEEGLVPKETEEKTESKESDEKREESQQSITLPDNVTLPDHLTMHKTEAATTTQEENLHHQSEGSFISPFFKSH